MVWLRTKTFNVMVAAHRDQEVTLRTKLSP